MLIKYSGNVRLQIYFYLYNKHPTSLGGSCWEPGVLGGENKRGLKCLDNMLCKHKNNLN